MFVFSYSMLKNNVEIVNDEQDNDAHKEEDMALIKIF